MPRYLAVDVDGCLFSCRPNWSGNHLSPRLIELAKTGQYDGFFIVTHRAFEEAGWVINDAYKAALQLGAKCTIEIFFLTNIIANFSSATNLKCIAVSTADDWKVMNWIPLV